MTFRKSPWAHATYPAGGTISTVSGQDIRAGNHAVRFGRKGMNRWVVVNVPSVVFTPQAF